MATFEQTLEGVSSLLRCPLCENELQSTFTVKECGHHFCQKCIYPELGTSCKCPTCSIPARVGNLLRNPSYDILVACTTKLRTLLLAQTRESTPELPRGADEVSGTPIGSIVWTYDCGPTFPNSGPLSSWSSNIEIQTFPSLNTAMVNHGRERAMRLRDVALTPSRQTSEERDHSHSDGDAAQKSTSDQSRAAPPAPTISQLQRLLNIRNEHSIMAGSHEKTTPIDPSSLANESSESSDDGNHRFVTPRMPTPPLQPLQSSILLFQVPENNFTAPGDTSQLGSKQSRKRRMLIEEVHPEHGRSMSRRSLGRKKRLGNQPSSSRNDTPSKEQYESQPKTSEWIETNAVPTSDDEERTHDVKKELDEEVLEVVSSQPLSDMILPNCVQRQETSLHSSNHKTHHRSHLDDPVDPTDTSIRRSASASRPRHSDRKVSRTSSPDIITCIFTGLSKSQRDAFDQNIARVIEAGLLMEHVQDQPFSELTTHIITNVDSDVLKQSGVGLCPRMLKYLYGMLSQPWIVCHEWFVDSIRAAAWLPLPQADYAIQGDTQFGPAPGTQTRRDIRLRRSKKLFGSCRMFFYGTFDSSGQKSLTKDELLRLVRAGGAETWQRRPTLKQLSVSSSKSTTGSASGDTVLQDYFSSSRPYLYVTEDVKPWDVSIDRTAAIVVCDPGSIPSGCTRLDEGRQGHSGTPTMLSVADMKKHAWLRDYQAVSLSWLLNCISCSIMGAQDIELLYGPFDGSSSGTANSVFAEEEIRKISDAWMSWRNKKE